MFLRHARSKQQIALVCLSLEATTGSGVVLLDKGGNQEKTQEPGNGRLRGNRRVMVASPAMTTLVESRPVGNPEHEASK